MKKCCVLGCDRHPKRGRDPRVVYTRCDHHVRAALAGAFGL